MLNSLIATALLTNKENNPGGGSKVELTKFCPKSVPGLDSMASEIGGVLTGLVIVLAMIAIPAGLLYYLGGSLANNHRWKAAAGGALAGLIGVAILFVIAPDLFSKLLSLGLVGCK